MPFNSSQFKNYADLQARIDAARQARITQADPFGQGAQDGFDPNNFSANLGGQNFQAQYGLDGKPESLAAGTYNDPQNFALSANPDGSIGQRGFSPVGKNDYSVFAGAMAALGGPLAYGAAAGNFAGLGAQGGGLLSNAALGLDAQGFALNPLASLGAGAPTAAEAASGVLTTTGAAGAAGGAGGAGLTAGQLAAGAGAVGTAASLANGASVPDTSGVHFSDAGYGAQNGIDPSYTGSGTAATGGIPDYLKFAQQALQVGSGINGLLNGGAKQSGNLTNTTTGQIDPRMGNMLYGDGTANNTGALGRILSAGASPQKAGTAQFGQGIDNYLGKDGLGSFAASQQAAQGLQGSHINAPQMNAAQVANTPGMQSATMNSAWNIPAASMNSAQINAPGQNNTNLSPAYNDFIYGQAGNNPYLTGAIQKGINQSTNAFQAQQLDSTRNFSENVLGNLRGGAQMAGQYGGSRQGLAEGMAARNFGTEQSRALSQYGQNNTDAAVSAQAGAYGDDRNRSLSATQGLGAQQYGVATNNAGFQQQANSTNAGFAQQANLANQANQQQTNVLNSGYQQQANAANYQGGLSTNMANAGYQNSANSNNLSASLGTNSLNSQNQATGTQLSGGLLNTANSFGSANDGYGLNRATQTASGLGPFTGLNNTSTQSQPLYTNPAGNFAAGATAVGGLLNSGNDLYNTGSKLFSNIFG